MSDGMVHMTIEYEINPKRGGIACTLCGRDPRFEQCDHSYRDPGFGLEIQARFRFGGKPLTAGYDEVMIVRQVQGETGE